jgi:hypothetical protein
MTAGASGCWPAAKEATVRAAGFVCCVLGTLLVCDRVVAQPPVGRPYDGIQAGLDAFRLAEEQRQAALNVQLATNARVRAWSGLPTYGGTTIYYGVPGPIPMDLDFAYGFGVGRFAPQPRLSVFEPWPLVPNDIYGYVLTPAVRQPIGQWQGQTGPRRWESHPVYDPPLPDIRPLPEVESPLLDRTPYATPRRGPREY